jgi:hypothetical protein
VPSKASTASAVLRTEAVPVSSCFISGSKRYRLAARLHFASLLCLSCQQTRLADAGMQLPAIVDHFNVLNHAFLLRFVSDSSLPSKKKRDRPKPVTPWIRCLRQLYCSEPRRDRSMPDRITAAFYPLSTIPLPRAIAIPAALLCRSH